MPIANIDVRHARILGREAAKAGALEADCPYGEEDQPELRQYWLEAYRAEKAASGAGASSA